MAQTGEDSASTLVQTKEGRCQYIGADHRQQRAHLSRDSFSERALSALNISTTTSTVMATVMGTRLPKASQLAVHLEDVSSSPQVTWGPFCGRAKALLKP